MLVAMGVFCLMIFAQFILSYAVVYEIQNIGELKDRIHEIEVAAFDIRNNNLNYLNQESRNVGYFATGRSQYLWKTKRLYKFAKAELGKLMVNPDIERMKLQRYVKSARVSLYRYQTYFHETENKLLTKGYAQYGLIGQMDSLVYSMEKGSSIPEFQLLKLKNFESQYSLTGSLNYIDSLNQLVKSWEISVPQNRFEIQRNALVSDYLNLLTTYVNISKEIGFGNNNGLKRAIFGEAALLDKELLKLTVKFNKQYEDYVRLLLFILGLFTIVII